MSFSLVNSTLLTFKATLWGLSIINMASSTADVVRDYFIPKALTSTFVEDILPDFAGVGILVVTCDITLQGIRNSDLSIKDKYLVVIGIMTGMILSEL